MLKFSIFWICLLVLILSHEAASYLAYSFSCFLSFQSTERPQSAVKCLIMNITHWNSYSLNHRDMVMCIKLNHQNSCSDTQTTACPWYIIRNPGTCKLYTHHNYNRPETKSTQKAMAEKKYNSGQVLCNTPGVCH